MSNYCCDAVFETLPRSFNVLCKRWKDDIFDFCFVKLEFSIQVEIFGIMHQQCPESTTSRFECNFEARLEILFVFCNTSFSLKWTHSKTFSWISLYISDKFSTGDKWKPFKNKLYSSILIPFHKQYFRKANSSCYESV